MRSLYVTVSLLAVLGLALGQTCYDLQWMCDNGNCVYISNICDGFNNCGDNSDEGGESGICPKCPSGYYKCDNGRCIVGSYTCDGRNDCQDNSDESERACPCSQDEFRCRSPPDTYTPGKCIPSEQICDEDGIWDCPFGDDETNCTRSAVKNYA